MPCKSFAEQRADAAASLALVAACDGDLLELRVLVGVYSDVDECVSSPCTNGICIESDANPSIATDSYLCACTGGWHATEIAKPVLVDVEEPTIEN